MRKLVLLAALAAVASTAQAAPREAFWFDSNNVVVKDGQGNCLRTSFWTKKTAFARLHQKRLHQRLHPLQQWQRPLRLHLSLHQL